MDYFSLPELIYLRPGCNKALAAHLLTGVCWGWLGIPEGSTGTTSGPNPEPTPILVPGDCFTQLMLADWQTPGVSVT